MGHRFLEPAGKVIPTGEANTPNRRWRGGKMDKERQIQSVKKISEINNEKRKKAKARRRARGTPSSDHQPL